MKVANIRIDRTVSAPMRRVGKITHPAFELDRPRSKRPGDTVPEKPVHGGWENLTRALYPDGGFEYTSSGWEDLSGAIYDGSFEYTSGGWEDLSEATYEDN